MSGRGGFVVGWWLVVGAVLLVLVGCVERPRPEPTGVAALSAASRTPTETVVVVTAGPTRTPSPTVTPTPLPTDTPPPTQTPVPTAAIWVEVGTAVPQAQEVISAGNVERMMELARWGRGVIQDVAFSADGQWLAVGTTQGVYLHDGHDLAAEPRYLAHSRMVQAVAFSPDGSLLALQTADFSNQGDRTLIELRRLPDGELLYSKPGATLDLFFSPDGEVLVLQGLPGLELWNAHDGSTFRTYRYATAIAFSPDGRTAALAFTDMVVFYDWESDVEIGAIDLLTGPERLGSFMASLAYSPDGEQIALGFFREDAPSLHGGTVEVRRVADGELQYWIERPAGLEWPLDMMDCDVRYRADPIPEPNAVPVRFSPDGRTLAVGYYAPYSHFMRLYRASEGGLLEVLNEDFWNSIRAFAFAPDQDLLVVATQSGSLEVRRASDGELIEMVPGYGSSVLSLAFAPNGQTIAVKTWTDMRLYQAQSGDLLNSYPRATIAFSPDGETMAVGHYNGRVEWQTIADGEVRNSFAAHPAPIVSAVFLDEERLVTAGRDCILMLWNVTDGRLLQTFEPYTYEFTEGNSFVMGVRKVLATPDGRFLIGLGEEWAGMWRVEDGRFKDVLPPEGSPINVAIAPNGDLMVVSGYPTVALQLGPEGLGAIQWQWQWSVETLALSPDGGLLATGSNLNRYGMLDLNRAADGERIWVSYDFRLGVSAVAFSPDGRYLVSGSLDGLIRVWGVP